MRIFEDRTPQRKEGGDDKDGEGRRDNSSGSETGSATSAGGGSAVWSDSNTTSSSANSNSRKRTEHRTRKRGRERGYNSNNRSSSNNKLVTSNSVPGGGVILTNGGDHHHHRLINGGFDTSLRSASASPRTGGGVGGRKNNDNSKILKRRRGKKFPPSTPTPKIFNYSTNNNNDEEVDADDQLSPGESGNPTKSSGKVSRALTLEDMELVDYEDLGSSSSTSINSSYSENEKLKKMRNENFQPKNPQSQRVTTSKGRKQMDGAINSNFGGGAGIRKDSEISNISNNNLSIDNYSEYNMLDDNVPCSSSSLRERLNSQRSNNNSSINSSFNKVSSSKHSGNQHQHNPDHDMITVYEDAFIEPSVPQGEKSLSESPSRLDVLDDDKALLSLSGDKYVNSGVGRHYGKKNKRSGSFSSLTDGGESLVGSGANGGGAGAGNMESFNAELLAYLMRLKAASIVLLGTIFVLSVSSLLFVFPIVVDPILLGLEAQFSLHPVNCRTTNVRSAKGPSDCSFPSCRAGCTADLFSCTFIDVEYSYYADLDANSTTLMPSTLPPTISTTIPQSSISDTSSSNDSESSYSNSSTLITRQGTLYININGCGYPPSVNCTEFFLQYGSIGREFMCFYSATNETITVPYYNYDQERHSLLIAIIIPIALAVFAALALFLLLKCPLACCKGNRSIVVNKSSSQLKLLDKSKRNGSSGSGHSLSSGGGSGGVTGKSAKDVSKKWKKRKDMDNRNESNNKNENNGMRKMNGVGGHGHHHEEFGDGPYMNGSVPKSNGNAFQNTISGLMGMSSPTQIHKTITTLPHQHDSLEFESPHHHQNQLRRPRYVKKNEVVSNKGPSATIRSTASLTQHESPLFTASTKKDHKNPSPGAGKLAEHKL